MCPSREEGHGCVLVERRGMGVSFISYGRSLIPFSCLCSPLQVDYSSDEE